MKSTEWNLFHSGQLGSHRPIAAGLRREQPLATPREASDFPVGIPPSARQNLDRMEDALLGHPPDGDAADIEKFGRFLLAE